MVVAKMKTDVEVCSLLNNAEMVNYMLFHKSMLMC